MKTIYINLDGNKIIEYPAFNGYILYSLYNFAPNFDKSLLNTFKVLIYPEGKTIEECLDNGWFNVHHIGDFRMHKYFSNYFDYKLPFRKLLLNKYLEYSSNDLKIESNSIEKFVDTFTSSFHNSMILEYIDDQKQKNNQIIMQFYDELKLKLGLCIHNLPPEFDKFKHCISTCLIGRKGYTATMYGFIHPLFYISLGCSQTGNYTLGISYHKLPLELNGNLLNSFNTILGSDIKTFVESKINSENKLRDISYEVFTFYAFEQNETSTYDSFLSHSFLKDVDILVDLRDDPSSALI